MMVHCEMASAGSKALDYDMTVEGNNGIIKLSLIPKDCVSNPAVLTPYRPSKGADPVRVYDMCFQVFPFYAVMFASFAVGGLPPDPFKFIP